MVEGRDHISFYVVLTLKFNYLEQKRFLHGFGSSLFQYSGNKFDLLVSWAINIEFNLIYKGRFQFVY